MGDGILARRRQSGKFVDVHVWNVFNCTYAYGYKTSTYGTEIELPRNGKAQVASEYNFDTQTGRYSLVSQTTETWNTTDKQTLWNKLGGKYFSLSSTQQSTYVEIYKPQGSSSMGWSGEDFWAWVYVYEAETDTNNKTPNGKGSATGNTVESTNENAYPQNGIQGNYWYVYSHSYKKLAV